LNDKALKHKGMANLKNSLQNKTKQKKILWTKVCSCRYCSVYSNGRVLTCQKVKCNIFFYYDCFCGGKST